MLDRQIGNDPGLSVLTVRLRIAEAASERKVDPQDLLGGMKFDPILRPLGDIEHRDVVLLALVLDGTLEVNRAGGG